MSDVSDDEVSIPDSTIKKVRERVLKAEKEKLHMDLARGINNDIEQIIREEVD